MRIETLWQRELRAARSHWWRQVLARPVGMEPAEMFDEVLAQRFRFASEAEPASLGETTNAALAAWS